MSDALLRDLSLAFVAGLLGSGHCLGMCGALVSSCFLRLGAGRRGPATHAAYHGARIAVYVFAGSIAAALGHVLLQSGRVGVAQGVLQIVAGAAMIVLGLDILGRLPFAIGIGLAPLAWSRRLVAISLDRGPVRGAALAGLANGLLPCSLTLAMAAKAAATAHVVEGAALMLCFGVGTLPAMVGIGVLAARMSAVVRARLQKVGAAFVIGMGVVLLFEGLAYVRVMGVLAW